MVVIIQRDKYGNRRVTAKYGKTTFASENAPKLKDVSSNRNRTVVSGRPDIKQEQAVQIADYQESIGGRVEIKDRVDSVTGEKSIEVRPSSVDAVQKRADYARSWATENNLKTGQDVKDAGVLDESTNNRNNNRTDSSSIYDVSSKKEETREEKFEERVITSSERQEDFFNSPGFERIQNTAESIVPSFGKPIEERTFLGKVIVNGVQGFMGSPFYIAGLTISTGEKLGAIGEATTFKSVRKNIFPELKRTGKETLSVQLNPTTTEGATSYLFAGLGGFSLKNSAFIKRTAPIKYVEVTINKKGTTYKVKDHERVNIKSGTPKPKETVIASSQDLYATPIKVKGYTVTRTTPITIKTIGVDVGSRSIPILSKTSEGIKLGNKGLSVKIKPEQTTGNIPQPATSLGGKALSKIVDYTPEEASRIGYDIKTARILGTDTGLKVKEFIFNIEGLKNPVKTSKIVEKAVAKNKGVFFGSGTTKQLPSGFRTLKPGDIDVVFPSKSVKKVKPIIEELTKELQGIGEDVQLSKSGKGTIIEFKSGDKFLEAKSGIDQSSLGFGDKAPPGVLGFRFPDLKTGNIKKTVPFGKARAITAGEQFLRKFAGKSIVSSGLPGETPSFSKRGVLGMQVNPRGLKDTAGYYQSGKGLVAIRKDSLNPFKRIRGKKAGRYLDESFNTYTPEQRIDILNKLRSTTGSDFNSVLSVKDYRVSSSSFNNNILSGTSISSFSSPISSVSPSSSPSPSSSSFNSPSPSLSPSPSMSSSVSPSLSPGVSPSPSVSPSTIPSPYPSPSPSSFPSTSFSPSTIPSPYPSPSPSSFPSTSFSPSTSIIPSPSPSPSMSPSPSISPPFSPPGEPPRKKKLLFGDWSGFGKKDFVTQVRKSGKWISVGRFGNFEEASRVGENVARGSSVASFRVLTPGKVRVGDFAPTGFYASKGESGVFIERNKFRINSPGERKEIPFKGLSVMSTRRKSDVFTV